MHPALTKACLYSTLVFFCVFFLIQIPSSAQNALEKEVSFNLNNITLKQALESLELAASVKFVYSVNQIDVTKIVSANTNGKTLAEILDQILAPLGVQYNTRDGNEFIVLSRANSRSVDEESLERSFRVKVSGKVVDTKGNGLAGINVLVNKTTLGTATDIRGNFILRDLPPDASLTFSSIGYSTSEVEIEGRTTITVVLEEEISALNEVVITAMGIERSEKSLSYSTQKIDLHELTRTRPDNLINSLNGKVLGVSLFPSASGLGGSAKVVLRGNRSFSQSNQPLYVLDGLPMLNSSNSNGQPNSPFGGQMDGGDGVSNLNPDDIESITILKGASASALYGSQAANGAILITTKKAAEGKTELNFNSSISVSQISYQPQFQNHYGRTGNNARDSWGGPLSSPQQDATKSFFRNGVNAINSLSLSVGSENSKTYMSYANISGKGVMPGNELRRNNFSLQQTQRLFNQRLTVDAGVHYIAQNVNNTPSMGLYFNPLTGLYLFPRGMDITPFKQHYEFSDKKGFERQNWFTSEDIQQNPWWIANRNPNYSNRRRIILSSSLTFDLNQWMNIKVRGNMDRVIDDYRQNLYSGTQATVSPVNGQFMHNTQIQEQRYADALLTFRVPKLGAFNVNGLLGASITDSKADGRTIGPGLGLIMPDVFIPQNIVMNTVLNPITALPENHSQLQSVFGSLDASYSNWLNMNFTGRKDWSSNLSFTPNLSYFYPSAGLSVSLKDAFALPPAISYFKLRANYAEVGNTVPQYVTNPVNYFDNTGSINLSTVAPFETLKPERTRTYEVGTDLQMFARQLIITFNHYRSNTYNQFIRVIPSAATGYSAGFVNAGNVQNTGVEVSVGLTVWDRSNITWSTSVNAANNINKIIDVDSRNGIVNYLLTSNDNTSYTSVLAKGGSYGDIYGITFVRDNEGRIVMNEDGTPRKNTGFSYIGNPNPKWIAGWTNTLTYKNFNLSFLIDGKFGGHVYSMTQSIMDLYGVSKETGDARDKGFVEVNGVDNNGDPVSQADPQKWYTGIGGRQGVSEFYIYSATVVRLREAALSYSFPLKKSVITRLRVSLTGRNLFYLYKKAPYDPELVMSTGNGLSGIDIFSQPAVRNFGLSLNLSL